MKIDLRSDTITVPTVAMRQAMANALVGDDAYGEDPSVNALEEYAAVLFRKEAAVFTCTGTMSNQLAVRALTQPGDEIILDSRHHINYFESRQTSMHAGVALNPCYTRDGVLTPGDVAAALRSKPRASVYSQARLVCIENSISYFGGRLFPIQALHELSAACRREELSLYMDGARLMNACIASGMEPWEYAMHVDAVSICCAKGLAAPFGSVLIASRPVVAKVREFRKYYGGALHQSGMMAAAALYALRNHVDRMAEDHANAKFLAHVLAEHFPGLLNPGFVETNIVHLDVSAIGTRGPKFVELLRQNGVLLCPWDNRTVRAVTHLGIERPDIEAAAKEILRACQLLAPGRNCVTASPMEISHA